MTNVVDHCILIGHYAGMGDVLEPYTFIFTVPTIEGKQYTEYKTVMTPEEFEVVNAVVRRCLPNPERKGEHE